MKSIHQSNGETDDNVILNGQKDKNDFLDLISSSYENHQTSQNSCLILPNVTTTTTSSSDLKINNTSIPEQTSESEGQLLLLDLGTTLFLSPSITIKSTVNKDIVTSINNQTKSISNNQQNSNDVIPLCNGLSHQDSINDKQGSSLINNKMSSLPSSSSSSSSVSLTTRPTSSSSSTTNLINSIANSSIINPRTENIIENDDEEDDDEYDSEPELPSLTWLTKLAATNAPIDPDNNDISHNGLSSNTSGNSNKTTSNHQNSSGTVQRKEETLAERYKKFMDQVKESRTKYYQEEDYYLRNGEAKPNFNYAVIIGMAMLENGRMTLQEICTWIEQKFKYFRDKNNWNNSIRHNLSLQPTFRKINRDKYEKGKGGYWELGIDASKGDRKRVRSKKSHVAKSNNNHNNNINNNNNNNNNSHKIHNKNNNINYNINYDNNSTPLSSPMTNLSSLEEESDNHNHHYGFDGSTNKRSRLNSNNNNDNEINISPMLASETSTTSAETQLTTANSLERIIMDVLENNDDIPSTGYENQHQLPSDILVINDGDTDNSSISNFLNHHNYPDDEDFCLDSSNLDVLEQTLQQIHEQNCAVATITFANNILDNDVINSHDNGIIDEVGNYITISSSQKHQEQQQQQQQPQQQQQHQSIQQQLNKTNLLNPPSIVQISTIDGCFNQIVEISGAGNNFLNTVNNLNTTLSSSPSSLSSSSTSSRMPTLTTTTTTTTVVTEKISSSTVTKSSSSSSVTATDMFDEELDAVGTMVDPTTMEAQAHQIYSPPAQNSINISNNNNNCNTNNNNNVPESCEDIVASVLNNYPCNGPSVVVEPIPSYVNCNSNLITSIRNNNGNANDHSIDASRIIATTYDKQSESISTVANVADIFQKLSSSSSTLTTVVPQSTNGTTYVTTGGTTPSSSITIISPSSSNIVVPTSISGNFVDTIDEEFNFFRYTDDVDGRRNEDVNDLFAFDGISAHEF